MSKSTLKFCWVALMAVAGAETAAAARWEKGYVVAFYDPAFRFGGRADYSRGTEIEPGVDCPHGSTVHFAVPAQVAQSLSLVRWRSPKEVEELANPPATGLNRDPAGVYFHTWRAASAYRGYNKEIETYINPFAAEDPGQPQVTSRIGEGFNLDGKVKPGDFVSPDGEKGIDNKLYRAWGCDAPWRGANGNGTLVLRSNDKMVEGLYTIVIRISGNKDPMNDDDATLEIGYSPDQIVKDARGNVGIDYSYRLLHSEQYTKLKARIKDGVAETEQSDIHMPQIAWFENQIRDAFFRQGKIRVVPNADGTAAGLVGGYRFPCFVHAECLRPIRRSAGRAGARRSRRVVLRASAQCRWHVQRQDRPLRRHLERLSHEARACFCRGARPADGDFIEGERGAAQAGF